MFATCTCLQHKSFETLWEKKKLLVTTNFSFSHSVFYPVRRTFLHLHENKKCRLQILSVRNSPKFVVWERVKQRYFPWSCTKTVPIPIQPLATMPLFYVDRRPRSAHSYMRPDLALYSPLFHRRISPLIPAGACEKRSRLLRKEICVSAGL